MTFHCQELNLEISKLQARIQDIQEKDGPEEAQQEQLSCSLDKWDIRAVHGRAVGIGPRTLGGCLWVLPSCWTSHSLRTCPWKIGIHGWLGLSSWQQLAVGRSHVLRACAEAR